MILSCADFDLQATLESGQVFGFDRTPDGAFQGAIRGRLVTLRQDEVTRAVTLTPSGVLTQKDLREYFDLDFDLAPVYAELPENKIRGLRLIRQDTWEALACFILSSNNNVKRIQGIYRNLIEHYRRARKDGLAGFPSAGEIARTHERTLRQIGLGYRAPYLSRTAQFVSTNAMYLETIRDASYEEALRRVIAFPGIGPKVADCVLLYGFHRLEAFPVDVWILRIMRKLYFRGRRVSEARVHAYGQKRWGPLAGYVQQYLFHGARTGLL